MPILTHIEKPAFDHLNLGERVDLMEIYCELAKSFPKSDPQYAEIEAQAKEYAKYLADLYLAGEKVPYDKWTARQYQIQAGIDVDAVNQKKWRTDDFYNTYAWFDRARLFVARIENVLIYAMNAAYALMSSVILYARLASALRLMFDTFMCLKPIFKRSPAEVDLPWHQCVAKQFNKRGRRKRMYNDIVWFPLALITILAIPATGGLSILIFQAVAFTWDVLNERLGKTGAKRAKSMQALLKVTNQNTIQYPDRQEQLKTFNVHLRKEAKHEKWKVRYNMFATTMILLGVLLVCFPPTAPAGIFMLVGACMSLGFGSVVHGFGRAIFESLREKYKAHKAKQASTQPLNDEAWTVDQAKKPLAAEMIELSPEKVNEEPDFGLRELFETSTLSMQEKLLDESRRQSIDEILGEDTELIGINESGQATPKTPEIASPTEIRPESMLSSVTPLHYASVTPESSQKDPVNIEVEESVKVGLNSNSIYAPDVEKVLEKDETEKVILKDDPSVGNQNHI